MQEPTATSTETPTREVEFPPDECTMQLIDADSSYTLNAPHSYGTAWAWNGDINDTGGVPLPQWPDSSAYVLDTSTAYTFWNVNLTVDDVLIMCPTDEQTPTPTPTSTPVPQRCYNVATQSVTIEYNDDPLDGLPDHGSQTFNMVVFPQWGGSADVGYQSVWPEVDLWATDNIWYTPAEVEGWSIRALDPAVDIDISYNFRDGGNNIAGDLPIYEAPVYLESRAIDPLADYLTIWSDTPTDFEICENLAWSSPPRLDSCVGGTFTPDGAFTEQRGYYWVHEWDDWLSPAYQTGYTDVDNIRGSATHAMFLDYDFHGWELRAYGGTSADRVRMLYNVARDGTEDGSYMVDANGSDFETIDQHTDAVIVYVHDSLNPGSLSFDLCPPAGLATNTPTETPSITPTASDTSTPEDTPTNTETRTVTPDPSLSCQVLDAVERLAADTPDMEGRYAIPFGSYGLPTSGSVYDLDSIAAEGHQVRVITPNFFTVFRWVGSHYMPTDSNNSFRTIQNTGGVFRLYASLLNDGPFQVEYCQPEPTATATSTETETPTLTPEPTATLHVWGDPRCEVLHSEVQPVSGSHYIPFASYGYPAVDFNDLSFLRTDSGEYHISVIAPYSSRNTNGAKSYYYNDVQGNNFGSHLHAYGEWYAIDPSIGRYLMLFDFDINEPFAVQLCDYGQPHPVATVSPAATVLPAATATPCVSCDAIQDFVTQVPANQRTQIALQETAIELAKTHTTGDGTVDNGTVIALLETMVATPAATPTPLPLVGFDSTMYVVDEDDGTVSVMVELSRSSAEEIIVNYETQAGSAQPGSDYTTAAGGLTFAPGEMIKAIEIDILDDSEIEPEEMFGVVLQDALGATLWGWSGIGGGLSVNYQSGASSAVLIRDNDDAATGRQVEQPDYTVREDAGVASIPFKLDEPADSALDIPYRLEDGSAARPDDYTGTGGTIEIPAGASAGVIEIPIVDDLVGEPDEIFFLVIEEIAGIVFDEITSAIRIIDNDSQSITEQPTLTPGCYGETIHPPWTVVTLTEAREATTVGVHATYLTPAEAGQGSALGYIATPFLGTIVPPGKYLAIPADVETALSVLADTTLPEIIDELVSIESSVTLQLCPVVNTPTPTSTPFGEIISTTMQIDPCVPVPTLPPDTTGARPVLALAVPTMRPLPTIITSTYEISKPFSGQITSAETAVADWMEPAATMAAWSDTTYGPDPWAKGEQDGQELAQRVAGAFGWLSIFSMIGALAWLLPPILISVLIRIAGAILHVMAYIRGWIRR
jgi:hypothetical protein